MTEVTTGMIISRLIENERDIEFHKDIGTLVNGPVMTKLKARRELLCEILVKDCGFDDNVVNAIVDSVKYRKQF